MKQPEWQRGGICGALSSTSQQLNIEPSEQRERERGKGYYTKMFVIWEGLLHKDVCDMGRVITQRYLWHEKGYYTKMFVTWEGLLHKDVYDMGRVITQRCL